MTAEESEELLSNTMGFERGHALEPRLHLLIARLLKQRAIAQKLKSSAEPTDASAPSRGSTENLK